MTTVAVVQARAGSSRLPGKVLERIGQHTMLGKVITRLGRARSLDGIVVATTDSTADDAVEFEARRAGAEVVRGATYDVLSRFGRVLVLQPTIDVVVRVTADCPFIDPEVIDEVVGMRAARGLDFAANRLPPPAPRTFPVGLDVEVATRQALESAVREASSPHHREHVMPFIYENPERFSVGIHELDEDLSGYRWTVDTPDDLAAVIELDRRAGSEPYSWRDVFRIAQQHPWIGELNSAARQKDVREVDARWDGDND